MRESHGPCGRCGKLVYRGVRQGSLTHPEPYHRACIRKTLLEDNVRAYKAALGRTKEGVS